MKEIKDLNLKDKQALLKMDLVSLKVELKKSSRQLYELKVKKNLWELKQTHLVTFLRRYLARLNSFIRSVG